MAAMAKALRFFPFITFLGIVTLVLFLLVEWAGPELQETALGQTLVSMLRVLIIPLWLMRTLVVMGGGAIFGFGGGSFPVLFNILTVPVLLLPYVLADVALARLSSPGPPQGRG
jgi:hypothetical protein